MKKRILSLIALFCAIMLSACGKDDVRPISDKEETPNLTVRVYGDENGKMSIYELPDGKCMLLDCGAASGYSELYRTLRESGIDKVDYLLISSADERHAGSAVKLIQDIKVDNIYLPRFASGGKMYSEITRAAKSSKCAVNNVSGGDTIFDSDDLGITVVSPIDEQKGGGLSVMIIYADTQIIAVGDNGSQNENDMIESLGDYMESGVMIVPDSGRTPASSSAFLQKISPSYAVIPSDGMGTSESVEKALESVGAYALRTDVHGCVTLKSDGRTFTVNTEF